MRIFRQKKKVLAIIFPVVLTFALIGFLLPTQEVTIESTGRVSFECGVALAAGQNLEVDANANGNENQNETCQEYLDRRLSEGWIIVEQEGFLVILESPDGILRPVDLRNDVETLRPNSDSTPLEQMLDGGSGDHHTRVDEASADGDSTYCKGITFSVWKTDMYGLPAHSVGSGTINSVTVYARARYDAGTTRKIRPLLKTHSTIYGDTAGDDQALTSSYADYTKQWGSNNPNTGSAWTWNEIDALEIGDSLYYYESMWCVVKGTKILMADGSHKKIEDIQVGEKVVSFDTNKKERIVSSVVKTFHITEPYILINNRLGVGLDHFIFCNGEFKQAREVRIGDYLKDEKGKDCLVQSIQMHPESDTYDITLDKMHNYFAEGYLVHNHPGDSRCTQVYVEVDYTSCSEDISNTPASYDFGVISESATPVTGLTHFTVTNNSGGAITITIKAVDWTGGTGWTHSDTATAGSDTVGLKAGLEGGDYTIVVKKTAAYNTLVAALADSGTQKWGLKLYAPTSFSDGTLKQTTITLTATCD